MDRRFFFFGSGAITLSSLGGCASSSQRSDKAIQSDIKKVDTSINSAGLEISILKEEMYKERDKMNQWGRSLNLDNWDYGNQGSKASRVAQSPGATFGVQPVFKDKVKQPEHDVDAGSVTGYEMAVVEAPKFFYRSGEYMLARPDKRGVMIIDPVSTIYINGVMNILTRVRTQYARIAKGAGITIEAIYTGGSDGLPIVSPITWAPTIGNFEGNVLLNGSARRMRLSGGQSIRSNEELALARAVAMSRELDIRLAEKNHKPLPAKFEIEISPKSGQLYRFAKVRFTPVKA